MGSNHKPREHVLNVRHQSLTQTHWEARQKVFRCRSLIPLQTKLVPGRKLLQRPSLLSFSKLKLFGDSFPSDLLSKQKAYPFLACPLKYWGHQDILRHPSILPCSRHLYCHGPVHYQACKKAVCLARHSCQDRGWYFHLAKSLFLVVLD